MNPNVTILKTDVLSDNWYTLRKFTFAYKKPNGEVEIQHREAYDRGNGAVILLYNFSQRTVILTRQFRLPTYINGNSSGLLIEACAGVLDEADPEVCIRRETMEETGYEIESLEKVMEAYMTPGSVTEKLHFFIAAYSSSMKKGVGGGVEHEHENIEVLELKIEEAMEMIDSGEIMDAKTIMLLLYVRLKGIV
nr:GDP-mannose pyrophosphatase NudK [Cytophagales bacterium]